MIVYRIEHTKTRKGPYNPGEIGTANYKRLNRVSPYDIDRTEHHVPTPPEDGISGWVEEEHFSAFANVEDIVAWFGEDFVENAAEAGFVISVYYASFVDVIVGGHQVAFRRANARRLREHRALAELTTYYPKEAYA